MDELRLVLVNLFSEHGFNKAHRNDFFHDRLRFFRRSSVPGLFDQAEILSSLDRTAVFGTVGCPVVPGHTAVKGLIEAETIPGLTPTEERGWSSVRTSENAYDWARAFVARSPEVAARITAIGALNCCNERKGLGGQRIASLLFVRLNREVDGGIWNCQQFDGLADREGMWRLQILASRVAGEPAPV